MLRYKKGEEGFGEGRDFGEIRGLKRVCGFCIFEIWERELDKSFIIHNCI